MKKKSAIVAENSLIIAMMTKLELEKSGINVIGTVNNYDDFIKIYNKYQPSLIFIDIHLEGMYKGINTIQKISHSGNSDIIFLLTYYNNQVQQKLKDIQGYQYLKKPFDDVEIQSLLSQYFPVEKGFKKEVKASISQQS
ncbi:response regulator [Candidatus Lokiarchaeum ossiferum]|uniref:response regulator n=1 Tax=Candidatus Lokiarchaeum ossiferum TaxID=2951803 RepID=UPI00352F2E2E